MEMSDSEEAGHDMHFQMQAQPAQKKFKVDQDISVASQQWQILREENDTLKCQLEAYKNEVELIKAERIYGANSANTAATQEVEVYRKKMEDKEKQMKVLQQTLQGMQQQLLSLREQQQKHLQEQKKLLTEEKDKEKEDKADSSTEKDSEEKTEKLPSAVNTTDALLAIPSIQFIEKIDERQARLIGVVATFLHVHPFGASIEYICSYLQRLNLSITTREMEEIMESLPAVFKQSLHGVGASLEKRWIFTGFENDADS